MISVCLLSKTVVCIKHSIGQEVKTEEVDNCFVQINAFEKVKLDLDIHAINIMCTNYLVQEEKSHLEIIKTPFTKTWDEIIFGERIMTDYTKFCQTKNEFTSEYFGRIILTSYIFVVVISL